MSATIIRFPATPRKRPNFYEAWSAEDPYAIAIHLAETRLEDTPDLDDRLKWARTMLNDCIRDRRKATARRGSGRDEDRCQRWADFHLVTSFIMIGHALGVEHPEDALFAARAAEGRPPAG